MKRKGLYFILIITGIILLGHLWNHHLSQRLKKDGIFTTGKIIELEHSRRANFSLNYTYNVDEKIYEGSVACSFFRCENGKKGCKGKEVNVIYSKSDPSLSDIDLGIYNNKKGKRLYY